MADVAADVHAVDDEDDILFSQSDSSASCSICQKPLLRDVTASRCGHLYVVIFIVLGIHPIFAMLFLEVKVTILSLSLAHSFILYVIYLFRFHKPCIGGWVVAMRKGNCPICRATITDGAKDVRTFVKTFLRVNICIVQSPFVTQILFICTFQ